MCKSCRIKNGKIVLHAFLFWFPEIQVCASGADISWWSSACCDCIGQLMRNSLCWWGCCCLIALALHSFFFFHLQLAVLWSFLTRGRCQALASIGFSHWQAFPTCSVNIKHFYVLLIDISEVTGGGGGFFFG